MADAKTSDYEAVLAELEARRAALDMAIEAVRSLAGLGPAPTITASPKTTSKDLPAIDPTEIPAGAFHGLSIADAARQYLGAVQKKQSTREIAEALKRGGLHSDSKNYLTTIYSVLGRQSDIARYGKDWGLASWSPGYASKAATAKAKPKKRTRARRKKRAPKSPGVEKSKVGTDASKAETSSSAKADTAA